MITEPLPDPDAPGGIEDIYPLSPMQQGLLFHTLLAPRSGVYVTQWTCEIEGPLDPPEFERAWLRAIGRHPILRTSFQWEGLDEPVQVVHRGVAPQWNRDDWRSAAPAEQTVRLGTLLRNQRRAGFDLTRAPLLDLSLIRLRDRAYRFIWNFHHLILDGWCLGLVLKEVFEGYDASRRGNAGDLEPSRPYRDYIEWLGQQDRSAAEAFWRREMTGFDQPTPLVVDRAPVESDPQWVPFGVHTIRLSEAVTAELRAWTRSHRITASTLLQGAWALLLSRYSGSRDVLFGAAVSGRPASLAGVERMVGLFTNLLPVRVRVPRGASLLDWLTRLQSAQADARQYEHVPLMEIQRWSGLPRTIPLFETGLVFQNYPGAASLREESDWADGLRVRSFEAFEQSHYPLTVAADLTSELTLRIQYDPARFDRDAIQRLAGHLAALIEGMLCAGPETRLERVPLLTSAERAQILREWSGAARVERPALPVHRRFEAEAERAPRAIALRFEGASVTYEELNRRANRWAHRLRAWGVGIEDRVALCLGSSPDLVMGMLGILKAGGAFLPLDPEYSAERLAFMLDDAGVAVVLTERRWIGKLPAGRRRVVCVDEEPEMAGESDANPTGGAEADNVAYVIYTSGSTGRPKGTLIPHRGLCNLVESVFPQLRLGPGSRVLQFASPSFDASIWEIFTALLSGATLCLARSESKLPGPGLARLLGDLAVTTVTLPPSVLAALEPTALPALETVVSAGERCAAAVVKRWAEGRRFINAYGPTESSVCASLTECVASGRDPSIGRPIDNTRLYVVDESLDLLPVGVPGELLIGGAGLARGYLNQPGLTAEKFIPDPFGPVPGARLYRSGDRVRLRPDGELEFIDRLDRQVKLRGFRIEPGEIEAVLRQHAGVRDAVVLLREEAQDERRLVAYVVPRATGAGAGEPPSATANAAATAGSDPPAGALSSRGLWEFLRAMLPAWMVPSEFVVVDIFPMTSSGKLDREALARAAGRRLAEEAEHVAPAGDLEERIAAIWRETLRVERVGADDPFFELGGHSLLMIQVFGKLRETLGLDLSMMDLFRYPTVRSLARHLQSPAEGGVAPRVEPDRADRLSAGRRRLHAQRRRRTEAGREEGEPR